MKRIPDVFGNELLVFPPIGSPDCIMVAIKMKDAEENISLGIITPHDKTFTPHLGNYFGEAIFPLTISAKFISEAKTFDKVTIVNETITLNSLLYLLSLPHGIKIDSFAELVYIDADFKFIQFKSKFEAMLYMCDRYEEYFNAHPDKLRPTKIDEMTITDQDRFIESSLLTIRNYATSKKGGDPYFMQLAKYYNYLKANEVNHN